jgi:flagella basal body P-ring formation protein FlgA
MVKPVGSPCAAVPQRPIIHSWAMSGPASIPTFDAEDAHLTRTGYCHVTSRFPSFDFDICDMAITPAGDWPLLPTSLQSGGDAFILDSNRAGELTAHGFAGRGGGRGLDQVPPLTADEARAAAAEARAAAASEGLELVPSSSSETGFKGVCTSLSKFVAHVRENGKLLHLGTFATREEAALCYARSIGAERAAAEAAEAAEARDNGQQPQTADEARAAAAAEGLELVPSSRSETGFKGVVRNSRGRFEVFITENGKQRYISIFATREEAALCYARSIGAERAAAEAAEAAKARDNGQQPLTADEARAPRRPRDNGQQPLTADEARAAAAAEGLELVPSSRSETGFKGVRNKGGRFEVFITENGKQRYISTFATPEEAALCYARSIGAERAAAEAAEARTAEAAKARAAEAAERKKAAKAKRKAELDARDVPLSRLVEPRTTEPSAAITYAAASIADAIAHTAPAMPTWQQPTPPAPPPRVLTTAPPVLSATPGAPAEDREEGAEELDEIMDDDIP